MVVSSVESRDCRLWILAASDGWDQCPEKAPGRCHRDMTRSAARDIDIGQAFHTCTGSRLLTVSLGCIGCRASGN
jgi:hypothetical protein